MVSNNPFHPEYDPPELPELEWKQIDATTWQSKPWQISFGEFSSVYSVCWFDDTCAIGHAAFDTLDEAKDYCFNMGTDAEVNRIIDDAREEGCRYERAFGDGSDLG